MKFWDREKAIRDLKRYLQSEPNAILFVYGPKSSGKSTLLERVARELGEDFKIYWYDLRGKVVSGYRDVLGLFFREMGWKERMLSTAIKVMKINLGVFELDSSELEKILSKQYDAFEIMERELLKDADSGFAPVIVFDEIQKLKGIYVNGGDQRMLVDELFNFFVRVTKVLHLAHVLVMTSDTFFIEEVYSSSALKNTSRYYLVDYFDDDTAFRILVDEGLPEEDARYAVEWIGGVPWMIEEIVESEDPKITITELYKDHRARLLGYLDSKKMRGEDIESILRVLEGVLKGEFPERGEELLEMKGLVEAEVLFYDPLKRAVRFQTKLDERAARELIG